MKKILSMVLAAVMALSLTACGGQEDAGTPPPEEKPVKNPVRSELYDSDGNKMADIAHEYDSSGRRISNTTTWVINGESETDTYTYDENGNVVKKVYTNSYSPGYENVTNYIYDTDGRLIKENHGAEEFYMGYEYDENGHLAKRFNMNDGTMSEYFTTYQCDAQGNVLVMTDDWDDGFVATNTYSYDADGKMLKMDYAVNGQVLYTHEYEYDAEGNLTKQGVSIEIWKIEGYVVHYYE